MSSAGFVHLHVHSAYSLLKGSIKIQKLGELAKADRQPALALTDTDNMFGALEFSDKMAGYGIQPIVGCELAVDFGDQDPNARNALAATPTRIVLLAARDRGLYSAVTDCGAGGFSSAVGEMGAETGAEVWLDRAPLKYSGLSYTEIWISEAQERMVLSVPRGKVAELLKLSESENVEATVIGEFGTPARELVLYYAGTEVGRLSMEFLHDGIPMPTRKAVVRSTGFQPVSSAIPENQHGLKTRATTKDRLLSLLAHPNIASKHWVVRQYDHEVQGGSVVKPLVGVLNDGPSDAAVVRPVLSSRRGIAISCGMNPRYGDIDTYHMAASAIDEAVRNCVAVGADPGHLAILDNFCWGDCERAETLESRACANCLAAVTTSIRFLTPYL